MTPLRLKTATPQSQVKHSTTEPLGSRVVGYIECLLMMNMLNTNSSINLVVFFPSGAIKRGNNYGT